MSFVWYGMGLFMVIFGPTPSGPFLFFLALFMIVPTPFFIEAHRAVWTRRSSVTREGLSVTDHSGTSSIAWSEIVFAEVRTYSAGRSGTVRELIVASSETSLVFSAGEKTYGEAVRCVFRQAPPTAVLAPPEKDN
jgi:hypothetical protein